jgi:biotin carboxylase
MDGSSTALSREIENPNVFHHLVDIKDENSTLALAIQINPHCVLAPSNDAGIISAARIAEHMGLAGPGVHAAKLSRNKYRLRELTSNAGVLSPWFKKVDLRIELSTQINQIISYPCVVKPVTGSGSKGVLFVRNKQELVSSLLKSSQDSGESEILVEEFVEGIEYSLEGIVQEKQLHLLGICKKTRSDLPYLLDTKVESPSGLSDVQVKASMALATKVSAILQVEDAPIHMEYILNPEGKLFLVECAVRAAGFDLFSRLISWCIGINTSSQQLDLILGKPIMTTSNLSLKSGILKFPQIQNEGIITSIIFDRRILQQNEEAYLDVVLLKKVGEFARSAQSGSERIGYFLIFGRDAQHVLDLEKQLNFKVEVS